MKGGIIAIKLDEDDALVDVRIVNEGQDVVLGMASGMSIRFAESDARSMGRATRGVKGVKLSKGDSVVGLVVADTDRTLLTVCEKGYGKRTPFGPGELSDDSDGGSEDDTRSNMQYRRQKRGGKGLRDIRTTERNGKVVDILSVAEDDHLLMITSGGKIQRILVSDISQIGRNTQGVRVIRLKDDDQLVSCARIPGEIVADEEAPPTKPEDAPENTEADGAKAETDATPTQPPTDESATDGESTGESTENAGE